MNNLFPNANNYIDQFYENDNNKQSYIDDRILNNDKKYRISPYCKQSWGSMVKYVETHKMPDRLLDQGKILITIYYYYYYYYYYYSSSFRISL